MNANEYWKSNLRYLFILLSIWFIVSFGFSILLVDVLDDVRLFGFKLGFWFAQQGSIYVFIVLIFVYVRLMNRLDHKHGLLDPADDSGEESSAGASSARASSGEADK